MLHTIAAFDRLGEENAFAVLARATALAAQGKDIINLGIGQPTMVADHLDADAGVVLHTENGMLGMGPAATGDEVDHDLTNAGKIPVTELPGASYFHHADSFAMMRGGHLDVCVLGAFQVSEGGDLANWHTGAPGAIPAVGGAMDLAIGAKKVFVSMEHATKDGTPKILKECSLPLTGKRCVHYIVTEYAFIQVTPEGLLLQEVAPGVTAEQVQKITQPKLIVAKDLRPMLA